MFVHFVIVNIHSRTRSLMSNCRAWCSLHGICRRFRRKTR